MNFDELMMERCLELAANGAGAVAPNPMVGAVIVHKGKIIGEGFHQQFGAAHAEINAFDSVKDADRYLIRESELYVNLEPCNHTGKTPPCTDRILREQIKKVIIGTSDPNPLVSGKGITRLKESGIQVQDNVLSASCRSLNKFYFTFHELHRPYITIKWAQSSNHFVAEITGKPVRFTNKFADILVHKWRAEHASILVGGKTIISDDPLLTVRNWQGKNPVRIVINSHDEMNSVLRVFNQDAETILFNFDTDAIESHVKKIKLDPSEDLLSQIINHLYKLKINSVLVEGGPKTIKKFIDAQLWDEAKIFIASQSVSEGIHAPSIPGRIIQTETIFDNLLITTRPL